MKIEDKREHEIRLVSEMIDSIIVVMRAILSV